MLASLPALRDIPTFGGWLRDAGVSPEEIRHAILLTLTTIGFPRAMAALSWVQDTPSRRAG
jgi:alkylhydroperoxidase/carboxymuconolactone decarboxylase family protein YurZ